MTKPRTEEPAPRICALDTCDKSFVPGRSTQKFCCIEHGTMDRNRSRSYSGMYGPGECENCGKGYTKTRKDARFCSGSCANEWHNKQREPRGLPTRREMDAERQKWLSTFEAEGYVVHKPEPPSEVHEFDASRIKGDRVRLALISDTHLGSKQQQLSYLRDFAAYCRTKKVDAVLHCGDVVDGPPQMHPGHLHNIFLQTYEAQRTYAIENLPDFGVPTYIISGNHDESWLKNNAGPIVEDIAMARGFTFVGQSAGYVRFGEVLVYMHHPHDGGSYALSYKLQKKIEALSPESKPHIFLAGNYHKATHLPAYRNVEGFLLPSYQAQTPFMVSKGLPSVIGGVILEFGIVTQGLAPSLTTEWVLERVPKEHDW